MKNPIPGVPQGEEFLDGLLGDFLMKINDAIADGIIKGFTSIMNYLLVLSFWTAKSGIIVCMLVYYCSGDKKAVTWCIKLFFIYLIISISKKAGLF
jgi:hypothetical protein